MITKRSRLGIAAITVLLTFAVPSVAQKQQKLDRVEKLPTGANVATLGTFLSTRNVFQSTFDAPLDRVWMAAKLAARSFDKDAGRPVVAIDEESNRIQNGMINQMAMATAGAWGPFVDEFLTEVTRVSGTQTRVAIVRTVMQRERAGWGPQKSNGKIEKYLLTQIADNLNKLPATIDPVSETTNPGNPSAPVKDYTASAPGKYLRKDKATDYIDLNRDGTFFLQQDGKGLVGTYRVQGDVGTLVMPNGAASRGRFNGDTIIDPEGIVWVKQPGSSAPAKTVAQLTNDQVVQMVTAKLSDELIIATIENSTPKFDLAPDALVKLKQAGASDAILRAMVKAGSR